MTVGFYIEETKLKLFESESIELEASIANVNDITKNTTDFVRSVTVPAEGNEGIFKHYYNQNIDNGFDSRIRVSSKIELDGFPFKKGIVQLNKANIKNGKPFSYNITFYGNLSSIKELTGDDELKDLDLSAFDFEYTFSNIKQGLQTSLFGGDIIYNLLSKKQLYYNSDSNDDTNTPEIANIAWGGGSRSGVIASQLKPSIRAIKIIEAIEVKYGFTFSRDFFSRSEFTELFLWLNNTSSTLPNPVSQIVDFDGGDDTYMNLTTNIGTYPVKSNKAYTYFTLRVTPESGFENINYTIKGYINNNLHKTISGTNNLTLSHYYDGRKGDGFAPYEIYYEIFSSESFEYTVSFQQQSYDTPEFNITTTASVNTLEATFIVSENIPKIKVIDFLKGLFNAFKLIIDPIDETSFFVNTLNEYYAGGQLFDLTKYVDVNNASLESSKTYSEINFNFEDSDTIANKQFEKLTGQYYGNEDAFFSDDNGKALDGGKLDYSIPFEQFLYERLEDLNDSGLTTIQYGAIIDIERKPLSPKPHLFYNLNTYASGKPISLRTDVGVKNIINTVINVPRHEIPTNAFLFSEEVSTWNGDILSSNLYTNNHQNYVTALFNIKRRTFKYKAKNIPLRIMLELSLDDLIQIQDNYYRIDKYNLNLTNGDVEFNLITSFDNTINGFYPSNTFIDVSYKAQDFTIYVLNLLNYSINKIDSGDGIGWVSVSDSGSNLILSFDENDTGRIRTMQIEVTNTDTLQSFILYITQDELYIPSFRYYDERNSQYLNIYI